MPTNQQYLDNIKIINGIAYSFHCTTGLDLEDLQAQANLCYCQCINNFDSAKGSFKAYLRRCLRNELCTYVRTIFNKENMRNRVDLDSFIVLRNQQLNEERQNIIKLTFSDNKNKVIKKIYNLIMSSDKPQGGEKGWLTDKLVKMGFGWGEIRESFKEIKQILNEV